MKKTFLFSINLLYIFHFIGILNIISIFPLRVVNANQININVENLPILFWIITIISLLTYSIFLRGLNYLRKTAKFLLSRKPFSETITKNLKNSGKHFLLTGAFAFLLIILIPFFNNKYQYEVVSDINLISFLYFITPLFLMITGMFFLIQSKMLLMAKKIENENELTI